MSRNIDVSLIRTFVAVAEHGSMTAVAGRLHLTQGAVSQHIRRLEEMAGAPLFERDRPKLRLTPAGEGLLERARRLLEVNDDLLAQMRAGAPRGQLRLGLPKDLAGPVIAPVLKAFSDAQPDVDVLITCGTSPVLQEAFAAGSLDLAMLEEPAARAQGERLRAETLVWVGAAGGSAHRKRPLPLSLTDTTCAFRPLVIEALREHGLQWRSIYENGSLETNIATVQADLAVTAWLASVVPDGLHPLDADCALPALPAFQISLLAPARQGDAAAEEMARCIRTQFCAQPAP